MKIIINGISVMLFVEFLDNTSCTIKQNLSGEVLSGD